MPLAEFQREHAGDIDAALLAHISQQLEGHPASRGDDGTATSAPEPVGTVTRTTRRGRAPPPWLNPATQTRRGTRLRYWKQPKCLLVTGCGAVVMGLFIRRRPQAQTLHLSSTSGAAGEQMKWR